MPGNGSPTPRRARSSPGFTLLELMVVMGLLGVIAGLAAAILTSARKRSARACAGAEARTELVLARRRLVEDIHRARSAKADDSSLTLAGSGAARVVWDTADGRLRRTEGDQVRVFRLPCQSLAVGIDRGGTATGYIEVRVVPTSGPTILAAAARTRIAEDKP